jgi:hypothetical protein
MNYHATSPTEEEAIENPCPLCGEELDLKPNPWSDTSSRPTCCGFRICGNCESRFSRNPIPFPKTNPELEKDYKRFLAGKAYPEIACTFELTDGTTCKGRLKNGKILGLK